MTESIYNPAASSLAATIKRPLVIFVIVINVVFILIVTNIIGDVFSDTVQLVNFPHFKEESVLKVF